MIGLRADAARVRPGGDPRPDRIIWADPFDSYSQWAADNQANPAYQPRGTLWQGGPAPAGSISGTYPWKSDNGTSSPDNGCGVTYQYPGFQLARQQWVANDCATIVTPAGDSATPSDFWAEVDGFLPGTNCGSGGWVETIGMFGRVNSVWGHGSGMHTSLGMFTHDLEPRIQAYQLRAWDQSSPNAVNGTDEHPLSLIFYLNDSGTPANPRAAVSNSYMELNLNNEHAPTDYIWRGDRNMPYPGTECCPEGPYPIICQQVREVNTGNYEQGEDLTYLNTHCPSLVPAYDPGTGTGKTWPAIAFGFLAIGDKDPCKCMEQGDASHMPRMNHPMLFNGNVWRELRSGRGAGLTACPPDWGSSDPTWGWGLAGPETTMQPGTGPSGDFSLGGGTHLVYMKLTTTKIMVWMHDDAGDFCGAYDRVYQGPFNKVAWGVGPGCELKDKVADGDEYACKPGGTPKQCLTYSSVTTDGYSRTYCDAMSLLDGQLVHVEYTGACCLADGSCLEAQNQTDCQASGQSWRGAGSTCAAAVPACCSAVYGDFDRDGDVDMPDFAKLQTCLTIGSTATVSDGCRCFDRSNAGTSDGKIDALDVQHFVDCAQGPNVPGRNTSPCVGVGW